MSGFENENFSVIVIDGEKYLLYIGDDVTDVTEVSVEQSWQQEKSPWDNL